MARYRRTHLVNDNIEMSQLARKQLTRKEFASRLTQLMNEREWSGSELARQAGIGRAMVSDYVRAVGLPEPGTLKKLADAFGMEPVDLLPNYDGQAIEMDQSPSIEVKSSTEDPSRMWIRMNREVTSATAIKIQQALEEDRLPRKGAK